MKKNELIEELSKIDGNPDICVTANINGLDHDIKISSICRRIRPPSICTKEYLIADELKGVNEFRDPTKYRLGNSSIHNTNICVECGGTGEYYTHDDGYVDCDCIDGKSIPAIPDPKIKELPDCPKCDGKGKHIIDETWKEIGQIYKDKRQQLKYTLRKFCMKFDLDPIKVYKFEEGIFGRSDKELIVAYGSLFTSNA